MSGLQTFYTTILILTNISTTFLATKFLISTHQVNVPVGIIIGVALFLFFLWILGSHMGQISNLILEGVMKRCCALKRINTSFNPNKPHMQWAKDMTFGDDRMPNQSLFLGNSESLSDDAFLMVHGVTCSGPVMYSVGKEIHNTFNFDVYMPTLPGHGGTLEELESLQMSEVRNFVKNQIWYLAGQYKTLYVMGHSLGGLSTTYLWLTEDDFPSNVKIILCAPAWDTMATPLEALYLKTDWMSKYMVSFMDWMYAFCGTDPTGNDSSYYTCFLPTPKRVMARVVQFAYDFRKKHSSLKPINYKSNKRICLIFDKDIVVRNTTVISLAKEMNFKLVTVPNCGHSPFGITNEQNPVSYIKDAITEYLMKP